MGLVYIAECLSNGKSYVGITTASLQSRKRGHRWAARKDKNTPFYNALRKYGEDGFSFRELASASSLEELHNLEKLWILVLRTFDREFGYNATYGGEGRNQLPETVEKLRAAKLGRPLSAHHRAQCSKGRKGIRHSEEARRRISEGQTGEKNWAFGKKFSPEYRAKISAGKKLAGCSKTSRQALVAFRCDRRGAKMSDETRQKMSIAQKVRWSKGKGERLA